MFEPTVKLYCCRFAPHCLSLPTQQSCQDDSWKRGLILFFVLLRSTLDSSHLLSSSFEQGEQNSSLNLLSEFWSPLTTRQQVSLWR